jgi:hypothetical protein
MHYFVNTVRCIKARKRFSLNYGIILPRLVKNKVVFSVNFQSGVFRYYVTGVFLGLRKIGFLSYRARIYRDVDSVYIQFLLFSPAVLLFYC